MTKQMFVESVLLVVNGGELNDESAVQREDIKAYLPIAVNYAMQKAYNINIQVDDSRDIPGLFWGAFFNIPIIRAENRKPRIELPKGTVALPRNQGIRLIRDNCGNVFTPLSDGDLHSISSFEDILPGSKFFRLFPKYIELYDSNSIAESVSELYMIVQVEDLEDNDLLPLQAGVEEDAYQLCLDKFDPQRKTPADKINNSVDLNTQP